MSLDRLRGLLGSLENSRAKNRRGSKGNRRNPPDVKKPIEGGARGSVEDMLNSNFNREYRPGLVPGSMRRGPNVRDIDFVHTQPGEMAGYEDRSRQGMIDRGIPRPVMDSLLSGRPGGGMRTMEFRDRNGNGIDDRDEPGGSHYNEEAYKRTLQRQEEYKAKEAAKEKSPTASTGNKGKDFEAVLRARMSKF